MNAVAVAPKIVPTTKKNARTNMGGGIMMSKEWILPSRPKPGRKPAADIPNCKRKAQNRAAQRAFRERRANIVNELEDKILNIERDRVINEGMLQDLVFKLRKENEQLKQENAKLIRENKNLKRQVKSDFGSDTEVDFASENLQKTAKISDELLNFKFDVVPLKRKRSTIMDMKNHEIDFTAEFAIKKQRKMPILKVEKTEEKVKAAKQTSTTETDLLSSKVEFESCGFCSDDTPCVCRDIANEEERLRKEEHEKENNEKLRREIEVKERELIMVLTKDAKPEELEEISKCTGNPGSCLQCQNDPMSKLFCKTVAEKRNTVFQTDDMNRVRLPSIDNNKGSVALPPIKSLELHSTQNSSMSYVAVGEAFRRNRSMIESIGVQQVAEGVRSIGAFVEVKTLPR